MPLVSDSLPAVSVIIPTFNGRKLLEQHLPSVLACLRDGDQLIIADDASTDSTVSWLTEWWRLTPDFSEENVISSTKTWQGCLKLSGSADKPIKLDLVLMVNQSNQRFAETCNRAALLATNGYIFLLNNDVEPASDVLEHLLPWFEDPLMFAVGCHEDEHGKKGGKNVLWFERGRFHHKRADDMSTGPTSWASGGSALFCKDKWYQLQGFDTAYYPAYWEDVDLSFRARQKGWRVWFDENAHVEHLHESTNSDVFGQQKMRLMSWRHGSYFTWQHADWMQKVSVIWWWLYWQWSFWRSHGR